MLVPSKSLPWASGKTLNFTPWVTALSKRGRRQTLRGILLEAAYVVTTDASGTLNGADQAKFFKTVQVEDIAGPRRLASGEGLRIMGYGMVGETRMAENASIAASQTGSTSKAYLYLPFDVPRARGRYDCLLPADLFRALKIVCPDQTTLDLVAGTTITSVDYVAYADVREDDAPEESVGYYVRDSIQETQMETATQGTIDLTGALLAEAFAFSTGASGGISMAGWTAHQLVGIEDEVLTASARLQSYRIHGQAANNLASSQAAEVRLDPITAARAAIVNFPEDDYRMSDLQYVRRALKIAATNTVATPTVIHRTIEEESAAAAQKVAQAYGSKTFYAKTATKSARDIKGWGALAKFMPKKGRS